MIVIEEMDMHEVDDVDDLRELPVGTWCVDRNSVNCDVVGYLTGGKKGYVRGLVVYRKFGKYWFRDG